MRRSIITASTLLALALSGCETYYGFAARNLSKSNVSIELRTRADTPVEAGAVLGPDGWFEWAAPGKSTLEAHISLWESGQLVGEPQIVRLVPDAKVTLDVDNQDNQIVVRNYKASKKKF